MLSSVDKLKQSNDELKEIVNNSWDGIAIIDDSGKFIYANSAFSPILGYQKEELTKLSFEYLILDEYRQTFKELLEKNRLNKYTSEAQIVCKRKDNQKVYLQITISLMLNKQFFVLSAKDITKQISDHEILDKYVLSSHTDLDDNITKISLAFSALSGYSKDDLLGKKQFDTLFKNNKENILQELTSSIVQGSEWSGKLSCVRKDNSIFWVDLKVKPIYNKYGDITGLTYLMFDITNEVVLASQKKNLTTQVNLAQDEIKQKDKILIQQSKLAIMAETLQMVSHEWRQPLNIISIQAQKLELQYTLDMQPQTNEVIQVLDNIKDTASKLSSTIEEFQNYVSLKTSKKEVLLSEIAKKAIDRFKADKESDNINFIQKISQDIPPFETYENELTTILLNLLINSKEAIKRNKISNGKIIINGYYENGFIYFEIIDNGGGIPQNIINRIFEPYFSTKESQHGVGLGLYTCKIIVENHLDGIIEASNEDFGAKFTIKLPI